MTSLKISGKLPTPHTFSSHPGHGSAAKTVAQYENAVKQFRGAFPAEVQQERIDHVAIQRGRS